MILSLRVGTKYIFCLFLVTWAAMGVGQVKLTPHVKDSLNNILKKLYEDDQKYRWIVMLGEEDPVKLDSLKKLSDSDLNKRILSVLNDNVGLSRFKKDSVWCKQLILDTLNTVYLKNIISEYGYPDFYNDPMSVSTILLHSPECFLDSIFFVALKQFAINGKMDAYDFATLYDRFLLRNGFQEVYYVLKYFDPVTSESRIHIPINLEITNKLRKEIGLKKIKQKDICIRRSQ